MWKPRKHTRQKCIIKWTASNHQVVLKIDYCQHTRALCVSLLDVSFFHASILYPDSTAIPLWLFLLGFITKVGPQRHVISTERMCKGHTTALELCPSCLELSHLLRLTARMSLWENVCYARRGEQRAECANHTSACQYHWPEGSKRSWKEELTADSGAEQAPVSNNACWRPP